MGGVDVLLEDTELMALLFLWSEASCLQDSGSHLFSIMVYRTRELGDLTLATKD
jgi:hypothetical protein